MAAELKTAWNAWALKLCESELGSPQLRSKCLLQKTVLLLQQQHHPKALDAATAVSTLGDHTTPALPRASLWPVPTDGAARWPLQVLKLLPDSKHAGALLATAQHKTGKKKAAQLTLTELTEAFLKIDDATMTDDFGHPLELTTALVT
jgi:hypothetical protein